MRSPPPSLRCTRPIPSPVDHQHTPSSRVQQAQRWPRGSSKSRTASPFPDPLGCERASPARIKMPSPPRAYCSLSLALLSLHPHPRSISSSSISPFSQTYLLLLFVYATALNQSNLLELKKRKSKYTLDLGYCGLVERGPGFLNPLLHGKPALHYFSARQKNNVSKTLELASSPLTKHSSIIP